MQLTVMFEVSLPFYIRKAGKWHSASCPLLDVHSQGPSHEKAVQNLVEAVQLFLLSCFERGVLDQVLKDCGFKPLAPRAPRPASSRSKKPKEYEMVRVPLPFLAEQRRPESCPV